MCHVVKMCYRRFFHTKCHKRFSYQTDYYVLSLIFSIHLFCQTPFPSNEIPVKHFPRLTLSLSKGNAYLYSNFTCPRRISTCYYENCETLLKKLMPCLHRCKVKTIRDREANHFSGLNGLNRNDRSKLDQIGRKGNVIKQKQKINSSWSSQRVTNFI